jgi:antitoxin (DNA-binding transcriptional repressor) of toxin-antitoxin stability system
MPVISIDELHARTAHWVHHAAEHEPIVLIENGQPVATIVPMPVPTAGNPFAARKLLPEYEAIMDRQYGGMDSTEIVSEMREGR